ncbi:MAG: penicillin-binding protein 2 [Actinomycetaceae bacterium]|nr:penicillin-binding protein 2 [Actinomycetaceae bacterium]
MFARLKKFFGQISRPRKLVAFILVGFAVCALSLVKIQVIDGPDLAAKAASMRTITVPIQAERGQIIDSRGTVLATSVERYNIVANPFQIRNYRPDKEGKLDLSRSGATMAAKQLAPILRVDPAELGGKLIGDTGYVVLAKQVSPQTWRKVRALQIEGITSESTTSRAYPAGTTAANVVGYVNGENKGVAGIEFTWDTILAGISGETTKEISPTGQVIPDGRDRTVPAQPGKTVQLTIDADLNQFAQERIDRSVKDSGAQWGAVIVQEVATGRILALADSGAVTPLKARDDNNSMNSRIVQSVYEPGSTGKIITFATALEKNKITPTSVVPMPYKIRMPNGQEFQDSHEHGNMTMTANGILAESSNTGTVQIGDRVKDEDRYDMMLKLGLGAKTNIELPGETAGLLQKPQDWDGRQRYTTMFGQGMAASPIQISGLMSTVANNGLRVPPHIVERWTDKSGKVHEVKPSQPLRAMSPDTAATLVRMLESVTTSDGTAKLAAVPGYRTFGKTGTTEILGSGGGTVASFVGAAPAEDPKVAVTVVVYRPRTDIYGGTIAAPVFSDVTGAAMRMLGVKPSTTTPKLYPLQPK